MFRTIFPSIIRKLVLLQKHITIHGPMNVKFVDAKQAKEIYQYPPDDGRKDRPKHVELSQIKINLRH